jgi:hypothetical protein
MNKGIPLDCTFEWDAGTSGERSGTLQVQIGSLADYRALVSRLITGTLLFDPQGHAQRMRLADPDHRPPRTFPAQATLRVIEEPFRDDDPRDRMSFGNGILQATGWVEAIDFQPPSSDAQEGRLVAFCGDADSYADLRRFVDEPHGSLLSAWDGRGSWHVNRISDTGSVDRPFPQVVTVTLRWLRVE